MEEYFRVVKNSKVIMRAYEEGGTWFLETREEKKAMEFDDLEFIYAQLLVITLVGGGEVKYERGRMGELVTVFDWSKLKPSSKVKITVEYVLGGIVIQYP